MKALYADVSNRVMHALSDFSPLVEVYSIDEAWRERPVQAHWRILYLDGIHFDVRHGDQVGIPTSTRADPSGACFELHVGGFSHGRAFVASPW